MISSELYCQCDDCGQEFSVIVHHENDVELEWYMGSDVVWYCPHCKTYKTHVNDAYEMLKE